MNTAPQNTRQPTQAPEPIRRAVLAAVDMIWAAMSEVGIQLSAVPVPSKAKPAITSRMSSRELLEMEGLPTDRKTMQAFDMRLKLFRQRHFGCYTNADPEAMHDSEYIYYPHLVAPVVEAFRVTLAGQSQS
ncbi:MAG: hypothetical protein K8T89_09255 [Planctomycetes bacterium]|nr:hypothetical protein [Planctomycetota bacterium]